MTDSYSTEEEIVKKRRYTQPAAKKKDLKSLFDEDQEEESYEEPLDDGYERSTVFYEIFGTGKEYFYVLEDQSVSGKEDEASEESIEAVVYSSEDCKRFVVWNTDISNRNLERFIELLLKGYTINYVLLHDVNYDLDIYEALKVKRAVVRYKEFVKARSNCKVSYADEILSFDALKYIPKYEEGKKKFRPYGANKFFLTVEQFETNLKDREAVFVPCCYESEGDLDQFEEEEYISQLSSSFTIRDFIYQLYKIHGSIDRQNVYKFFLSSEADDQYNDKRRDILDRVIDSVKVNEEETRERLLVDQQKAEIFNAIFDRIFNGSLKRLASSERIISCTKENNTIKGVVLDNKGEVKERFSKSKEEFECFADEILPFCILLSGFSPGIRLVMQSLISRNCFYVDNCWFRELDINKYDFCTRIGRLALFPELEYIRLSLKGFKKDLVAQVVGIGDTNELIVSTNDINTTIKEAILASISITGLDLNLLLSQPDRVELLTFLGVSSITRVLSVENYLELAELENNCATKSEYVNIVTYLRLFPEYSTIRNTLDSTNVHPENYFIVNEIVETGDDLLDKLKENSTKAEEVASAYNKGIQRDDDILGVRITKRDVNRIVECILHNHRPEFSGFPDRIAFQNLSGFTPGIIGSVVEGRVFYTGEGYVLVSVLNNVTVFCLTKENHFVNKLVKVRIEEANEAFVSFNGAIVVEDTKKIIYPRFCKHPLYKELDANQAENYLNTNNELILLRRSTQDNSPILVFQFYPSIYVHYKLEYDDCFVFRGKKYETVDLAISNLIKPVLRNVQAIAKHKHFYKSKEEAEREIEVGGDYIKYGFYFSKEYPGRLCFIYNNKGNIGLEYIGVYEDLSYKGNSFATLNDFLVYRKRQ